MSFHLTSLNREGSPKDCFYIFDSNILLPQLGLPDEDSTYSNYLSFLSKVIKGSGTEKLPNCKVVISPLQMSEVFNKLLRYHGRIHWEKAGKGVDFNEYYKGVYRKSDDFKTAYENIKDDFEDILEVSVMVTETKQMTIESLLNFDAKALDFNDNYLYQLALETGAILVSHDADFYDLNNLQFATYRTDLYQRFKDSVMVRAKMKKYTK